MKRLLFVPVCFVLIFLSACHKLKDYWKDHHDADDHRSYKIARWDRIITDPNETATGTVANFTYDNYVNPLTVIFDETATGDNTTNWKFVYDGQRRLSECYMHYGPNYTNYFTHTKYAYDASGRIAFDTVFYGGPPNTPPIFYVITDYSYDAQGRIITEAVRGNSGPLYQFNYSYDANGNLVIPGYTYDNKVSFFRTHPVWQFINRNYSRNNALPAVTYNKAQLPKQFDSELENPRDLRFLRRAYNTSTFTYTK